MLPCLPGHPGALLVGAASVLVEVDVDPVHSRVAPEPLDLAGGELAGGQGGGGDSLVNAQPAVDDRERLGVADGP